MRVRTGIERPRHRLVLAPELGRWGALVVGVGGDARLATPLFEPAGAAAFGQELVVLVEALASSPPMRQGILRRAYPTE